MARHGALDSAVAEASAAPGSPPVSRADLLLSGSSADELVEAISRWAGARWRAEAVQLWLSERQGLRLLASRGRAPDEDDRRVARACLIGAAEVIESARSCLPVITDHAPSAALLVDGVAAILDPDGRAQLVQVTGLLAQRLPAALELESLHHAVTQLAEAERLQRALFSIAELAGSQRDMGEVLAKLHTIVAGLMYSRNFFIALLDRGQAALEFPYFRDALDPNPPVPGAAYPLAEMHGSLTAHVIATGETLMGPSETLSLQAGTGERFGPQSVDWLGVPLESGGEIFGAVVVQSYDERHRYTDRDRALLTFVAQHIATALQRRRAQVELEQRVEERTEELREANLALRAEVEERQRGEELQAALFRIAELGSTSGTSDEFYAAVHRIIGRLLYAGNFYIAMLSDDGEQVDFPYSVDEYDATRPGRRLARGLTEYVLRTGQPLLADRATNQALHASGDIATQGAPAAVWLGVPLVCDSGTVGVLAVQSYDEHHTYTVRDQEILTFVSYHIANALERKRAAEKLRLANAELERRVSERTEALYAANRDLHQQIAERERIERQLKYAAAHDALTGLPNRAHFLQQLGDALARARKREESRFAVLFLDLDRFKVINDSVGHLVGDDLLKEAGARIAAVIGGAGLVARLGGDEFAVLLEPLANDAAAVAWAERIIIALDAPIRAGGKELFTAASIGIAVSRPHYLRAEDLLRDADVALYRAKARGRRCHDLFDETLRRQALHQLELEGNLRRALVRAEFEPVFQPIVQLDGGAITGYEALMRWRHPQRGMLAPEEFLAIAEESGLAEAMDWQVYELVFAQGWALVERGGYISINVGARHFRSNRFVPDLLQLMERYEFSPKLLRVEVTERTLLDDPDQAGAQMRALREAGIALALDDFGTGYSSLSYLHQFPLNALKVDRSFILALDAESRNNAQAVLRAICTLGRSLGMDVIAEGIETRHQLETVRLLGCELGQGYLFSLPKPLAELVDVGRL